LALARYQSGLTSKYPTSNEQIIFKIPCIFFITKHIPLFQGGSDEICKIYDLVGRVEHGQLMHHEVKLFPSQRFTFTRNVTST